MCPLFFRSHLCFVLFTCWCPVSAGTDVRGRYGKAHYKVSWFANNVGMG